MKIEDRQDLLPPLWADDGMSAKAASFLELPEYRIMKCFRGWRVHRGKERSPKLPTKELCRAFIDRNARRAMLRQVSLVDPGSWMPIWAAPRNGWAVLACMREDITEYAQDPRLAEWAGQQLVIRHAKGAMPESDIWDMAAPTGSDGIPGDWFTGWRPLAVAMPPRETDVVGSVDRGGNCSEVEWISPCLHEQAEHGRTGDAT
ncbi:hypothetical protein ACEUZ9_005458 [Paracoccus litorisediminis]|uniref:hypothetical protein n=1 Tax=Paracoccus litorisediminis TaxID=2006130 RepID=UPI00373243AB